jgi:hypothetical protein
MTSIKAIQVKITQGNTSIAIEIMPEAAARLTGKTLWRLEDIPEHKILASITKDDVYVSYSRDAR